jgi:ATP-dependent exoDNAse (exonuclease V) beta subunit
VLNGQALVSVTQIVGSQFKPFNARVVASILENTKSNDPESQYFGMDKYQIQNKWAQACREAREMGTELHQQIECFYKHGNVPDVQTTEFKQFLQFVQDHPAWHLLASEYRVHNDWAAGTIDAVFDTPKGIVLVDWKRAKSIDYAGANQGRDVMKHVADCNYSKYSLQLSLYKKLMAQDVRSLYIIQMHPDIENYRKIRAVDFSYEAAILLTKRTSTDHEQCS